MFIRRVNKFSISACKYLVIVMVLIMTVVVFLQVVMRYIFLRPFSWAEELARFLLIWISCLGAACAMREGMHITIAYFRQKLPKNLQSVLFFLNSSLVLIFFAICSEQGILYAFSEWRQLSPAMQVPMTFGHLAVPVGFGIMILVSLELFIEEVKRIVSLRKKP